MINFLSHKKQKKLQFTCISEVKPGAAVEFSSSNSISSSTTFEESLGNGTDTRFLSFLIEGDSFLKHSEVFKFSEEPDKGVAEDFEG